MTQTKKNTAHDVMISKRLIELMLESHGKNSGKRKTGSDLREIMLLDNQSTADLFCNEKMAGKTRKSCSKMQQRSN